MSKGRLDFEGDAMRRGRKLEPIVLTSEENNRLLEWTRRQKTSQALARRARIVLACRQDRSNRDIGREVPATAQTVGRVVNRHQMAKHFTLTITDTSLAFARKEEAIAAEAALDGIDVIRTSVRAERLDAPSCVRHYQSLSRVERAFRSMKTVDLKVRPLHHRLADRVRAHLFLCLLAYHVEWHLREAWRELLFADGDPAAQATRDPVAPAERSEGAKAKVARRHHADGTPLHSFRTLLTELATIVRNTCRTSTQTESPTFSVTTQPHPLQAHAMGLIDTLAL